VGAHTLMTHCRTCQGCASAVRLFRFSLIASHDLSRIHQIERVDCLFDGSEQVYGRPTKLIDQILLLTITDTVLSGACALHRERALGEAAHKRFGAGDLIGAIHHHGDDGVEVAVANVPKQGRDQSAVFDVLLGLDDTFGEARDGEFGRYALSAQNMS
jgi:hypothetical protein